MLKQINNKYHRHSKKKNNLKLKGKESRSQRDIISLMSLTLTICKSLNHEVITINAR